MYSREADVAILMPTINPENKQRFIERYSGLSQELRIAGAAHAFAFGHASFTEEDGFYPLHDANMQRVAMTWKGGVVRDLTMTSEARPIYAYVDAHPSDIQVVHTPEINRHIADKAKMYDLLYEEQPVTVSTEQHRLLDAADVIPGEKVVIKPTTGMLSQGVQIVAKTALASLDLGAGTWLVQEYIDTTPGIPELTIAGVHNLRAIAIAGRVIGLVSREMPNNGAKMLRNDYYGRCFSPDQLPESMYTVLETSTRKIAGLAGGKDTVIAIDLMRGVSADGQTRDYICEVNRRPLRISPYDLRDKRNTDPDGLLWIAKNWDKAEAAMLTHLSHEMKGTGV